MIIDLNEYLEHHGVKGQRWGVRNIKKNEGEKSNKKRNAAIILGSAAVVAAVAVGAVYAKKHMGVSTSSLPNPASTTKKFAESLAQEPVGIVHASRGKNRGFTFPQRGGLNSPIREYEESGLASSEGIGFFRRYGKNNEKVAARFADPLGRKDFAGRPIPHDVMLPESMAKNAHSVADVERIAWPHIKDLFDPFYRSKEGTYGPGF